MVHSKAAGDGEKLRMMIVCGEHGREMITSEANTT